METQFDVQRSEENRASLKKTEVDLKEYWYIKEVYNLKQKKGIR